MIGKWIALVALGLLLAGVAWRLSIYQPSALMPTLAERAGTNAGTSDYYMEGVQVRHYSDEGLLTHTVQSRRIDHDPVQQQLIMQDPQISVQNDPLNSWRVRSKLALADDGMRELFLHGKVQVERLKGTDITLTVLTEKLFINTENNTAHTEDTIHVMLNNAEITGQGLSADMASEKLQITSAVRGTYVHQ